MKAVIIYGSHHHGNTEKVVKFLAEKFTLDMINAETVANADLSSYDLVGFASGIDFGKFYPAVTDYAARLHPGQALFAIYTCAKDNKKYGEQIRQIAEETGCRFLGKFGCKGYNTYGPWQLIGGMNKNHPDKEELANAEAFLERICSACREFMVHI